MNGVCEGIMPNSMVAYTEVIVIFINPHYVMDNMLPPRFRWIKSQRAEGLIKYGHVGLETSTGRSITERIGRVGVRWRAD